MTEAPKPSTAKYRYEVSNTGEERLAIQADTLPDLVEAVKKSREVVLFQAKPVEAKPPATPELPKPTETTPPRCGIHGTPMKLVPAGVSKKTGNPYPAFLTCESVNSDGSKCSWKPQKNGAGK